MKTTVWTLLYLALGGISANSALAQTSPHYFSAHTTVAKTCKITSITVSNTDSYDPLLPATYQHNQEQFAAQKTGYISSTVSCTLNSGYVYVYLDEGLTPKSDSSCSSPQRQMMDKNGNLLAYGIHLASSSALTELGCAPNNRLMLNFVTLEQALQSIGNGVVLVFTGQDVPDETYSDSLTLTVEF